MSIASGSERRHSRPQSASRNQDIEQTLEDAASTPGGAIDFYGGGVPAGDAHKTIQQPSETSNKSSPEIDSASSKLKEAVHNPFEPQANFKRANTTKALNPFQTPRPLQAILKAVSRVDASEFK